MIKIPQKVSYQVQKIENMHSESILVIDGEFHAPPVSQVRLAIPFKLDNTLNLPTFSGQEPVPSSKGLIDQWPFQVEGALVTHTEEVIRLAVIRSVRGAAHELLEFIGYSEEMDVIIRHLKSILDRALLKLNSRKNSF